MGEPDARTGRILDIGALDRYVSERLLRVYDHSSLNDDVPGFEGVPTTENLAFDSDKRLREQWPFDNAALDGVFIQENGPELSCAKPGKSMKKASVKVMNRNVPAKEPEEGPISDLMRQVLAHLGEDPTREGLLRTPARADKALQS
jgi:6-pyruvoyl-tetrahydropterin synthase